MTTSTRPGRPPTDDRLRGPLAVLDPADRTALLSVGRERRFAARTTLIAEGSRDESVVVVLEGRVRVVATTPQGHEVLLAVRGPGDVLGEFAAFDPAPRSATVSALEDVRAVVLPAERFVAFAATRPALLLALLGALSRRLRATDRLLVDQRSGGDTTARVAHRLLELAVEYGVPDGDAVVLDLPLTQQQLATSIGVSREAVNASLRRLRQAGVVATARQRVTLLDVDAVRSAATGRPAP